MSVGGSEIELRRPLANGRADLKPCPVEWTIVAIRKIAHGRNALLRAVDRHVPQFLAFMQGEILRDA